MLAEWLTPRVELSFAGRKWPLIFTHRALLLCQQKTGIDTIAVNLADPSASLLRGLLFSALSVAGSSCTLAEAGRRMAGLKLPAVRNTILEAWIASMPEPDKDAPAKVKDAPERRLTWLTAWAEATSRYGLGLSSEQWLDATPRQVAELQKVRLHHLQREELLFGQIAATVENFSPCHPKEMVSAEAFMFNKFDKTAPETGAQKPEEIGDYLMAQMAKIKDRQELRENYGARIRTI